MADSVHRLSLSVPGLFERLGGKPKTTSGLVIDVSSNGTTSLSGTDAMSIAMRRFKEMDVGAPVSPTAAEKPAK